MFRVPLPVIRTALIVIAVFNAVSALGGMVALTLGGGAGIPDSYLGPFESFVAPGLILGVVIGGTQVWSAAALIRRRPVAPLATAVAGFGMQIWIAVEVALVHDVIALHVLYFAAGMLQLVLLLGMLGVAPSAISGDWRERPAQPAERRERTTRLSSTGSPR